MKTWIKSNGNIIHKDDGVIHLAGEMGGVVGFADSDVRVRNGSVEVALDSQAQFISKPEVPANAAITELNPEPLAVAFRCSKHACIALVLICCDNNKVVGGCVGVSGC